MRNQILSVICIVALILAGGLSGCVDNPKDTINTDDDPPTIDDYIITTEDLPDGYSIVSIDRNQSNQLGFISEVPSESILGITYAHDSSENVSEWPFIAATIAEFISHKDAKDAISYSAFTMGNTMESLFNQTGTPLLFFSADYSEGQIFNGTLNETYDYANATWTYLFSRVNKTVFFVSLHKIRPAASYPYKQQTLDLMEIMIQRYKNLS